MQNILKMRLNNLLFTAVCIIVLLAGGSPDIYTQEFRTGFEEELNTTFIGVKPEYEETVARLQKLINSRKYTVAVRVIRKIIENSGASLVNAGNNYYIDIGRYGENILYKQRKHMLEPYREITDAAAQSLYAEGLSSGIIEAARKYALSSNGYTYLVKAGSIYFEKGYFSRALDMYAKAYMFFPDKAGADLLAAGFTSACAAGRQKEALTWEERIREKPYVYSINGIERKAEHVINYVRKTFAPAEREPAEGYPPHPSRLWDLETDEEHFDVLIDDTFCYVISSNTVSAYQLLTGVQVWKRGIRRLEPSSVPGLFSCGNRYIGLYFRPGRIQLNALHSNRNRLQPGKVSDFVRIIAANGTETETSVMPPCKDRICVIDALPLFYRDSVFIGYQAYNRGGGTPEIYVMRYSIPDREPVWNSFVCQGIGYSSGQITVSGGRLFYMTNRGAAAGLDIHSGEPRWAFRYPRKSRNARYRFRSSGDKGYMVRDSLIDSAGMLYTQPYDSSFVISFDYEGRERWKRELSGAAVRGLAISSGNILVAERSRIAVFSPAGDLVEKVPVSADARLFSAREGRGYFLARKGGLTFHPGDQKKGRFIFPAPPETVALDVQESRRYAAVRYSGSLEVYTRLTPETYAKKGTPVYYFLSARTSFSRGEWEQGETAMSSFFDSAGTSYEYEGCDLVPYARRILGRSRLQRAEQLFAKREFENAETWFRASLKAYPDWPDTDTCSIFRRITECAVEDGEWENAVRTARYMIRTFPHIKQISRNTIQISPFSFARDVISRAINEKGREIYASYEKEAETLFEKKLYERLAAEYPNSTRYLESLQLLSRRHEKEGNPEKAASALRMFIAGSKSASGREELQKLYLKMGMKGAAEELNAAPHMQEKKVRDIQLPLFSSWSVDLPEKKRDRKSPVRYFAGDNRGLFYEYGGELEKRGLTKGRLLWKVRPDYGWLGIRLRGITSPPGIEIVEILPDMPAEKNGFINGDLITAVNGTAVHENSQFIQYIKNIGADREVTFTFLRNGKKHTKRMRLGSRPESYLENEIRTVHLSGEKCIIDRNSGIECRNSLTGKRIWRVVNRGVSQAAFRNGTLCTGGQDGIRYIDAETGRTVWKHNNIQDAESIQYAGDRYLVIERKEKGVSVIDRYAGETLFTLLMPDSAAVCPLERGFVSVSTNGTLKYVTYSGGTVTWTRSLKFGPLHRRTVKVFREKGTDNACIWVNHKGGVLIQDEKVTAYVQSARKRFYTVANGTAVCAGSGTISCYGAGGSKTEITIEQAGRRYPDEIKKLGNGYLMVIYSLQNESRLITVDPWKEKRAVDSLELDPGPQQPAWINGKLYVVNQRGITCYASLPEREAFNQISECIARKTVDSGIMGARIALKLEKPELGIKALKPFLHESGVQGSVIEELFLKLRRNQFRISPPGKEMPANGSCTIELKSRSNYLAQPAFLRLSTIYPWQGPDDLSGTATLNSDSTYLTITVTVKDDIFRQSADINQIMINDNIAVGFEIPFSGRGLSNLQGTEHVAHYISAGFVNGKPETTARVKNRIPGISIEGSRNGKTTEYIVRIPWKDLTPEGRNVTYFRFGIEISDNDGKGIKGRMGWTPASVFGVAHALNHMFAPGYFGDIFVK